MNNFRQYLRNHVIDFLSIFKSFGSGVFIMNGHSLLDPKVTSELSSEYVFIEFLEYLLENCNVVDFDVAKHFITSGFIPPDDCPIVAFTFDDGFDDATQVSSRILHSYGIKAAYFVNSNFLFGDLSRRNQVLKNMNAPSSFKPISPEILFSIYGDGHTIGSHSLDHLDLSKLDYALLKDQILSDKYFLSDFLDCNISDFAWPFGGLDFISEPVLELVCDSFDFVFSSTSANNNLICNGRVINRRHIEPYWSKSHIRYFLSNIRC